MLNLEPFPKKDTEGTYSQNFKIQKWTPSSWQHFVAMQQPYYTNKKLLDVCLSQLKNTPPLVSYGQIEQLKKKIMEASEGQCFLLQAGDCAEQFQYCNRHTVENKINAILNLKDIIEKELKIQVTPIGRIAGQYAKPRSYETETIGGITLPSFRGDIIHSHQFSAQARKTNPNHMLTAYEKTLETLNYIQNMQLEFYTSHEALLLAYESALTRWSEFGYFNSSAPLLWLGERTRQLNGAHVEYLRGIQNPIGIKLSHKITNKELVDLIFTLNPNIEEGKIILIPRLGCDHVDFHLNRFIETIKNEKLIVTWMCDPMHGNGEILDNGVKTRRFDNILRELLQTVHIHKKQGSILGGIHLETSEQHVTECLGGPEKIGLLDLEKNYQSACDPRLNVAQSLELVAKFAQTLRSM